MSPLYLRQIRVLFLDGTSHTFLKAMIDSSNGLLQRKKVTWRTFFLFWYLPRANNIFKIHRIASWMKLSFWSQDFSDRYSSTSATFTSRRMSIVTRPNENPIVGLWYERIMWKRLFVVSYFHSASGKLWYYERNYEHGPWLNSSHVTAFYPITRFRTVRRWNRVISTKLA